MATDWDNINGRLSGKAPASQPAATPTRATATKKATSDWDAINLRLVGKTAETAPAVKIEDTVYGKMQNKNYSPYTKPGMSIAPELVAPNKPAVSTSKVRENTEKPGSAWDDIKTEFRKGMLGTASAVESVMAVGAKKVGLNQWGQELEALAKSDQELSKVGITVLDQKSFSEGIKDPAWIAAGVSRNMPNTLASLGVGVGTVAAGAGALVVGGVTFLTGAVIEGGFSYQDAKDNGADDATAEKAMSIVGIANGLLESLPLTKLLTRTPVGAQIKKKIVAEIGKRVVKQTVSEAGTESLQQIVSNSVATSYDQDRSLWDQLPESAFFGGIMGGGSSVAFDTADVIKGNTKPVQQSKAEKPAAPVAPDNKALEMQKQFEAKLAEAKAREVEVRNAAPSETVTTSMPANAVKQALDSETPITGIMKPETAQFVQQGLSSLPTVEDIMGGTTADVVARLQSAKKLLDQIAAQQDASDLAAATTSIEQDNTNLLLSIGDAAVKKAQEAGLNLGEYKNPDNMSEDWQGFVNDVIDRINIGAKNQYNDRIDGIIDDKIEEFTLKDGKPGEFEPAQMMNLTPEQEQEIAKMQEGIKHVEMKGKKVVRELTDAEKANNKKIAAQVVKYREGKSFITVKKGDFVVDRNGHVLEATAGNDQYVNGENPDDWNAGFFRAKKPGERLDGLEFANQVRKATPEEITKATGKKPNSTPTLPTGKKLLPRTTEPKKKPAAKPKAEKPKVLKKIEIVAEGETAETQAQFLMELANNASIGLYNGEVPVKAAHMDTVMPIEMPELVALAKDLMGSTPAIKRKMRNKLGFFRPVGKGQIGLLADIFQDPIQAAKTLAHEIGHLTGYLPERMLTRGNLLVHLYSLSGFTKKTYGTSENLFGKETGAFPKEQRDAIRNRVTKVVLQKHGIKFGDWVSGKIDKASRKIVSDEINASAKEAINEEITKYGYIKDETIRKELSELSDYWKPIGENPSPGYLSYRLRATELYADAISVLFNSPGVLQEKAPTFYKVFFDELEKKPDVHEVYWSLQDLLHGAKEELLLAREARIKGGFAKAADIQKQFAEKRAEGQKRLWERLRQQLDDKNYPIIKKIEEAQKKGAIITQEADPRHPLQELPYTANDNYIMVEKVHDQIAEPLKAAGMTDDDMGAYLMLRRIMTERAAIANPYGFEPKTAGEQMEFLKQRVGLENFALLEAKIKDFHEIMFEAVENGYTEGSIGQAGYEKAVENKYNYAAFAVVDHLSEHVSGTIKKQIGTFKEIQNSFYSMILKTAALNNLNNYQRAKNSTRNFLQANFPEEITKSRVIRDKHLSVFKVGEGKGALEMLEDGRMTSYDVDPYIAKSFEFASAGEENVLVGLLSKFNDSFKKIVTTYNPGFAIAFNPKRDFSRTYKNIPNASIVGLLAAYKRALPSARKFAKGQLDDTTRRMVAEKMIGIPQAAYAYDSAGDEMGIIANKFGLQNDGSFWSRLFFAKPVISVLDTMRDIANTFEVISKIAGADIRMRGGESGKILAHNVRNYTGTPNFKIRGLHTAVTNELFIFSNIMKEGLKSDYKIATDPKTRSGFWWKTAKIDLLPKGLMAAAIAGLLGSALKDFFDKVTEYDKTNYIIVPMGWFDPDTQEFSTLADTNHEGKKAVYFRIPHDETGRLISSLFWKATTAANSKENPVQFMGDVFAFGAGQLPNITPAFTIASNWFHFIAGKNPYDAFRGRTIIDDTTFAAGGWAANEKMIKWTLGAYGLSYFSTFDPKKNTTTETAAQMTPTINRLIKISDYGQVEAENKLQQEGERERARELLQEKDVITDYAIKYRKDKANFDFETEADNAVNDIIGHEPESEDEIARAKNIKQKFQKEIIKASGSSMFKSVAYATRNAEKISIIEGYRAKMGAEEFDAFVSELLDNKLISEDVYDKINE